MRLLLVDREFPPNPHGGIGAYNLALATGLGRLGHFVVVLSCTGQGGPLVTGEPYGLLVRIPHRPSPGLLAGYLRWLEPVILGLKLTPHAIRLANRFDLRLLEVPSVAGYGYFLVQRLRHRMPVVTRFHGAQGRVPVGEAARAALNSELARVGYGRTRRLVAGALNAPLWQLERRQVTSSHHVTFPSEFARQWLARHIAPLAPRQAVIPNGLQRDGRPAQPQPARGKILAYVGRCSVSKGVTVLARAAPRILDAGPDATIVVAGPLPDPRAARILSALSGRYPGRLRILGPLPHAQVQTLLAASYALLAPSFYEICPMAVLEAMACGTPAVASNTGPFPELVEDGISGLLFPVGDAGALAASVLALLHSPQLQSRMAGACRARFVARYDIQIVVGQLEAFYAQASAGGLEAPSWEPARHG